MRSGFFFHPISVHRSTEVYYMRAPRHSLRRHLHHLFGVGWTQAIKKGQEGGTETSYELAGHPASEVGRLAKAPRLSRPALFRTAVLLWPTHQPEKVRVCGRGGLPKAPVPNMSHVATTLSPVRASASAAKNPPVLLLSAAVPRVP